VKALLSNVKGKRVRVHDSTPHEPIFLSVNDLGKFLAPAPD